MFTGNFLKYILFTPAFLTAVFANIFAQDSIQFVEDPYYSENIEVRKMNEKKWKSLTENLNYNTQKKEQEEQRADTEKNASVPILFNVPGGVFYALFIIILIVILIKVLGIDIGFNKTIGHKKEISIDNLEEEIHESDLEKILKESLINKNYKLAIRIYYLIILKELSLKNWILWKKDKTNREYLYEMSKKETYLSFSELTKTFEKTWYGDWEIQESDYLAISPVFKNYIETIKRIQA